MRWNPLRKEFVTFILSQNWRRTKYIRRVQPALVPITVASANLQHFGTDESGEASPEDLLRWERMYEAGRRKPAEVQSEIYETMESIETQASLPVRVISFDLDNTVWKTSATIDAANDALALFLSERNVTQTKRVEKVMGALFSGNKSRYCPADPDHPKGPVLLTLLRKDAIQFILKEENGYSSEDALALADEAFDYWAQSRHEAIELHLVDAAVETLKSLSELLSGAKVKVGAITDGNSNPYLVNSLSGYFDFVVNAEQVGVAKPDKRIYLEAARQVLSNGELLEWLGLSNAELNNTSDISSWSDDAIEDLIGPWWVHVGDDFVKDVVAAKSLNMRSIWVKELIQGKVQNVDSLSLSVNIKTQQRSVEDLVKEVAQMKVVEMEVGAEDFLAQSLQDEFADAVVDRFADLSQIILDWHADAVSAKNIAPSATKINSPPIPFVDTESKPVLEVDNDSNAGKNKFCISCGLKLPAKAKFCSSCGEAQQ